MKISVEYGYAGLVMEVEEVAEFDIGANHVDATVEIIAQFYRKLNNKLKSPIEEGEKDNE